MSADGKTLFKFNRWKQAEEEKKWSYLPTHYGKNKKIKHLSLPVLTLNILTRNLKNNVCDWENFVQI